MTDQPLEYDLVASDYSAHRRPDPRILLAITDALGSAATVVNVGAGTGSYEPTDRAVLAVEPSCEMIRRRGPGSAPALRAHAEQLPFRDASFDAALAVLSVHHWTNRAAGLRELRRVASRVVILTWDPSHAGFWLVQNYFPDMLEFDRTIFPSLDELRHALGNIRVEALPIPRDCSDGFLGAYWARPHAYLDAARRGAISSFSRITHVEERLLRLQSDLASGLWASQHAQIDAQELDLGYRIVSTQ